MGTTSENQKVPGSGGQKPSKVSGLPLVSLNKAFRTYMTDFGLPVTRAAEPSGAIAFAEALNDHLLMVQIIKKGITYSLFEEIQKLSSLTSKDWASILNISLRSLQRYKDQNQVFKPIQSEKIIELGQIFILGNEVFGDPAKFKSWLETPNFALGGVVPTELLSDSYGQQLLINELTRINYGIFA